MPQPSQHSVKSVLLVTSAVNRVHMRSRQIRQESAALLYKEADVEASVPKLPWHEPVMRYGIPTTVGLSSIRHPCEQASRHAHIECSM